MDKMEYEHELAERAKNNETCNLPVQWTDYMIGWNKLLSILETEENSKQFINNVMNKVICKIDMDNFTIQKIAIASHPYDHIYVKIWVSNIKDEHKWYDGQNRVEDWILNPTRGKSIDNWGKGLNVLSVAEIPLNNIKFQLDVDQI